MLGMAPRRWMQMLAALLANAMASWSLFPSNMATANAAVKQSPAPVVSTTELASTWQAFCRTTLP